MTTRQRLIEMAASQVRRNGGAYDEHCAHEAIEHIALYKMGGEYRRYYEGISQDGLNRLVKATVRRVVEQMRSAT